MPKLGIPSLPRRLTVRSRRSVERILDAAARKFGHEGYDGASMTAVARAAGVSKGLLHYHFQNKEALLLEAQRAVLHTLWAGFTRRSERQGVEAAARTLDQIWAALVSMRKTAPFMVETIGQAVRGTAVREDVDLFYTEGMALLEEGIREVFSEDLHRLRWPPERLANMIRVFLHGSVIELAYARTDEDFERLEQTWQDCREAFLSMVLVEET